MLIEAAKGGHVNVVNLLLDWPNSVLASTTDATHLSPHSQLEAIEVRFIYAKLVLECHKMCSYMGTPQTNFFMAMTPSSVTGNVNLVRIDHVNVTILTDVLLSQVLLSKEKRLK